ncbi:MAG: carboxypeptidase regulatory-like domain-containing protein [Acidobacteriia bacterium]|nr:carboxypeptidase regulatory-like domain-containing protein [Terriglobia bacterium]
MKTTHAIVFAVLLCLTASPLAAQVTTAGIFGTVNDRSGAVVPGADVTVINIDTNFTRSTKSDAAGEYSLTALPLGPYRVEATVQGFKKYVQTGVVLDVSRNARVDVILDLGAVAETMLVTADAPLVNVANAQIGRTVENIEILQMPLVNRDLYSLLNLTPGVEMNATANTVGFRQTTVAINGSGDGGTGSVAYYLDGGVNMTGLRNTGNATPNPDTVEEFRVITNSYGAEFGRFTAGVVDVVTKSGTNTLHGSLFEFLRNDLLNANGWGVLSRPTQRRNQFGGSGGGPIRRDKLFIFGSYSGLRQRFQDVLNGAIVPTAAERTGDFSASAKKPTGAGITNSVIAPSALDPTAMKIINTYVFAANLPGSKWQGTVPRPSDSDDVNLKLDYLASSKHQVTGSYFYTKGYEYQPAGGNIAWSQQDYTWKQQNLNAGDTWTIGPTALNQFRVTYVRNFGGRLNLPDLSLADLGSKFTIQGPKSLPQIGVSGYMTLSEAIQGPIAGSNYYGIRDSVTLMRGRHSLKMGVDTSLEKFIQDTSLNNYGVWSFDGKKTGNALADFMMGLPASFKQDTPCTKIDNDWYTGLFIQDDIRLHPRFTLNLGLRYEVPTSMTDPLNRKMTFAPGVQSTVAPNAPLGLLFPGDTGVSRGIINPSRKMFAPRLGMAWDPFGDGKTSIRAAAGIFYGSISSNNMNMTTDYQPFSARQTFANVKTLSDPYGNMPGGSPFPISYTPGNPKFALLPADVSTLAQNFHFPYTYQLNFSVQRQLRNDLSVTAAYVGALTHHLPFTVDKNYPFWNPTASTTNLPSRRPSLPGTLGIIYYEDGIINSDYHGLQTSLQKRMSHGITFQAYYVFSKSMEGAQTQNNQPTGGAEDFRNLSLERARTNNDRRHTFSVSALWQIDYFKGSQAFVRSVLNGWSLSVIGTARSGQGLTCTTGQDNNVDGNSTDRCDLVGDPYLDPNRSRAAVTNAWFNTAAFKAPVAGADGNSSRNLFEGPGQKQVDAALFRQFRLREAMKLEFRAELTNALNLVNLSNPTTNLNSALFGTINSAGAMRATQVGLRLSF